MSIATQASSSITATISLFPPEGFIKGGYGRLNFEYLNQSASPAKLVGWRGEWFAKDKSVHTWSWDANKIVEPEKKTAQGLTVWLPPDSVDLGQGAIPVVRGFSIFDIDGKKVEVPFEIAVPQAILPEKLELVQKKHIGLNLMQSRFKPFDSLQPTLDWLNLAYELMQDLTGFTPYEGKLLVLEEVPRNDSWGYAGNPIGLNTQYIEPTIKEFNRGEISFGWVHEMGHCFDFGGWYIWNGAASEWQANFKLTYVVDMLVKSDSRFKIATIDRNDRQIVDGKEFNRRYSLRGDAYLQDPKRTWENITPDEIHAFFMHVVFKHGWSTFKKWYRTFAELERRGLQKPESQQDKIRLSCAILSVITGDDMAVEFQRWKFPVTQQDVVTMNSKYPIGQISAAL